MELDAKSKENEAKDYKIVPADKPGQVTTQPLPGAPVEPEKRSDDAIRLNLSKQEKTEFITLIKDELSKIVTEYGDKDYYAKIEAEIAENDGISEAINFPIEDASNRKLLLTMMMTEIAASTAKRQTCFPQPMVLLEKESEIDDNALQDREDALDNTLRKKVDYEAFALLNYQTACKHGASITAVELDNDVETRLYRKTYSLENENAFTSKYGQELLNPDSKEIKEWAWIKMGESITKIETEETEIYYGPKLRIVPLDKFFARLSIKEFRRHRVIAEQMDFVWADIERRMNTGFYDEDAVLTIKQANSEYEKQDYKIYQAIVRKYYKGHLGRFVITFDDQTEEVVRAIFYPFKHNQIFYVACNAFPKTNSWLGYSFRDKLKDCSEIINAFLNSAINEFTLAQTTTILCDDPNFEGERKELKSGINILRFDKGTRFAPTKFEYSSMDRVQFLSWIQTIAEVLLGISASLMSGQETPADPRAPGNKTQLKFQASSLRIEDIISSLQRADMAIVEQIDGLCYQYLMGKDGLKYWENEQRSISGETYGKKVRYVMAGSRISFDKQTDFQLATQVMAVLKDSYPELWADINVRYTILSIMLNNLGGALEKNKRNIVEPMKRAIDAQKQIKQFIEGIEAKIKAGQELTEQEQAIMMKLQGGQGQQGTPAGAQGSPGQPPAGGSEALRAPGQVQGGVGPVFGG